MTAANAEIITNRYHILSLLQRTRASHAIVSLHRPHEQFIYNSAILSVDNDQNNFTIDSPAENQLPLQAKPSDWLKFRIKLHGLIISFEAMVEDIIEDATSLRSYRLQMPSQIHYQQRRGAFRASIGYQFKAHFSAQTPDNQRLNARLTDLSLGGASIEVDTDTMASLKNETPLIRCQLQMVDDSISIETATIRAIQMSEHSMDVYRLGLEFAELNPTERRNLQRWVMRFDRENRKSALSE